MDWYLNSDHLIGHVQDATYFEIPAFNLKDTIHVEIYPNPLGYTDEKPMIQVKHNDFLGPVTFQPTKFIVLELLAAILWQQCLFHSGAKNEVG